MVLLTHGADTSLGHPLIRAAEKGHLGVVQQLLQHMAAAQGQKAVAVAASTALASAEAAGHVAIVNLLLEYGGDARDSSACEAAASKGHKEVVQLTMQHAAISRRPVRVHKGYRQLPRCPNQAAVQHRRAAIGPQKQRATPARETGMLERMGDVFKLATTIAGSAVLLKAIIAGKAGH
jgi:hypothetical protein